MKKIFLAALLLTAALAWWFGDTPVSRDQLAWGRGQHDGGLLPRS
jgi:hypothetical protein